VVGGFVVVVVASVVVVTDDATAPPVDAELSHAADPQASMKHRTLLAIMPLVPPPACN